MYFITVLLEIILEKGKQSESPERKKEISILFVGLDDTQIHFQFGNFRLYSKGSYF